MGVGTLEVVLVNARGLATNDFFGMFTSCCGLMEKFRPYILIQYQTQEQKSSVAGGSNPLWNEKFTFVVDNPGGGDGHRKLSLKVMDAGMISSDEFVGQSSIFVEDLITLGVENGAAELHPTKYRVVQMDESYRGEIQVGIKFTLTV
ncbi:hypothetical protein MLD38_003655 [Melastoma candidum]|uniref:Uncharacterized protein n=1 Tax=Melastoma candidum TaxID=119954 RepID=A0ACB9S4U4_9MYRT|nr:hypothetical protein MLD38_003655 [Melastoma candidum]